MKAVFSGLAVLDVLFSASGHPGTWDGQVIMNEDGAPLPDMTGFWAHDSGRQWMLQLYQPPTLPAASPNSTYSLREGLAFGLSATCVLLPVYDYDTRRRLRTDIACDSADGSNGIAGRGSLVNNGSGVAWNDGSRWSRNQPHVSEQLGRYSGVHTVHVVFMNHYDVGYTDFINGVDNTYIHKYYPLAEETSKKFRVNSSDSFMYTTHPWLMDRFLNCPCKGISCLATTLNNPYEPPLECPSEKEVADFTAAAERGDIHWNGAPFNIQPENMSPELFRAGFDMVRRMDKRFGRASTKTMSIRDVIYVTRAVLSILKEEGIIGLTIGSNGADYPPQVPKLHRWVDKATGADTVVAYHPYGYGGFGLKDCAEAPNGVALCSEFRTDNTGPPSSVAEVELTLATVRKEYPGATVKSSTFDAFFADVESVREQLPVVDLEVADTWTYGTPSDPLKMAQHRAIQRAWIRCAPSDPVIQNMTFFLMKAPEHTWGTPGISGWGQGGDYNTTIFRSHLSNTTYMKAAASWAEQRIFNELAALALEEASHPLAAAAREELNTVENVVAPDLSAFHEVAKDAKVALAGGFAIAFRADGAIGALEGPGGVAWASEESPLAGFVYQTLNDTEWKPFTYNYCNDHQMQTGFCKPGSNNFTESALWRPTLTKLLVDVSADVAVAVVAVLEMPEKAWSAYGSFRTLYLNVSVAEGGLDLALTALGKRPTMVGEASMLTFRPAPALERAPGGGSAWALDKLGQAIDPEGVLKGGNQFTHGVWDGATVRTSAGTMSINSLDASNMNPMTEQFPVGNPLPASYREEDAKAGTGMDQLKAGSVFGMAANLHNNLWNTNYPLFYPYFDSRYCSGPLDCRNCNALFRFHLSFQPTTTVFT
mmetsp:Transcript_31735/g.84485  ORF Transcript_31735/g.84485 Transcript_31735/m.84485 type:complete len:878 (-) Transcript_31735:121-2754(-)